MDIFTWPPRPRPGTTIATIDPALLIDAESCALRVVSQPLTAFPFPLMSLLRPSESFVIFFSLSSYLTLPFPRV